MFHYILQTLIFQVLFIVLYDVFHKKDTFFTWNRLYLIITPLLSLLFPFIKIQALSTPTSQVYANQLERVITLSSESLEVIGTTGPAENPTNWWLILYCIGAALSFLLLILKFYKLKILTSFSFTSTLKNNKIVTLPNSAQAFSFWNTIYLGDKLSTEEKKQILIHELVHVEQKHSLDQIWFEILKIALWWNPMIYIYQSRVTILHEYLADAAVISTIGKRNYIEQLLNATFQTQEITFVNQFFNQSLIKKRILMLQKTKSKTIAKFKYLLLIPVMTGILAYTSCGKESNETNDDQVERSQGNEIADVTKISKSGEPKCPNQNSQYDNKLDNYVKVRNGKSTEVIIDVISSETSKKVRTVFITANTTQFIRNIPEGKYKIHVAYGEDYAEKTVDGVCKAYFKKEIRTEVNENTLDFNTVTTKQGLNVPSYNLSVDLREKSTDKKPVDNTTAKVKTSEPDVLPTASRDAEPNCPNKTSAYDNKLDNYLRLTSGKNSEILIEIISEDTKKNIRTVHMKRNQVYSIRNIPEGSYRLHIAYGEDYTEKTVDGVCKAYFKNEKATEIDKNVLDFNTITTKRGLNVPSYNMTVDMTDKDHRH